MNLRHARTALATLAALLSLANAAHAQVRTPVRVLLTDAAPVAAAAPRPFLEPSNTPRTDYRAAWRLFLARQRAEQIQRLEEYARAGVFPANRVRLGYTNLWRDDHGRLCAMANLVQLSGNAALVSRQATEDNFVRFADAPATHALRAWLATSGLTLEEAALIQEPYAYEPEPDQAFEQEQQARLRADYLRTARRLRATTQRSLDLAVQRLGALAFTPPA